MDTLSPSSTCMHICSVCMYISLYVCVCVCVCMCVCMCVCVCPSFSSLPHRAKQRLSAGRARDHPVMDIVPNKALSLSHPHTHTHTPTSGGRRGGHVSGRATAHVWNCAGMLRERERERERGREEGRERGREGEREFIPYRKVSCGTHVLNSAGMLSL